VEIGWVIIGAGRAVEEGITTGKVEVAPTVGAAGARIWVDRLLQAVSRMSVMMRNRRMHCIIRPDLGEIYWPHRIPVENCLLKAIPYEPTISPTFFWYNTIT
jgi:hypothetical protein